MSVAMVLWSQINLRDSASFLMSELASFHDVTILVLVLIMSFVGGVLSALNYNLWINKKLSAHHGLEFVWTILPAVILVAIAVPSLTLLFMLEDSGDAYIIVKALGRQWYWVYSWAGTQDQAMESYMVPSSSGTEDLFRLLDTTSPLYLPLEVPTRIFISSSDVLHSWTVPSFGVKADACPGRLNEVTLTAMRPGMFFGQCSEICGANHSFMPIQLIVWQWS